MTADPHGPIPPAGLSNALLYSTTRIAVRGEDGDDAVGTGFFFAFSGPPGNMVPVLVTNRHVVDGAVSGNIILHVAEDGGVVPRQPSGRFFNAELERFPERWIFHPDPTIDLCGTVIADIFRLLDQQATPLFLTVIHEDSIPSERELQACYALQDVLTVGYPNGLWDVAHGLPLFRRGITASHPGIEFQGKPQGVVDIAAFPGSSGSPIVVLGEGLDGVVLDPPREAAVLLGILWGGPYITTEGEIKIVEVPTKTVARLTGHERLHLGYYVRAGELKVLGEEIFRRRENVRESD